MKNIKILGAGISGLSAAINLAKAGYSVDVFEKREDCGKRFYGDLEGFENWSSQQDVLDQIQSFNVKINFDCSPFKSMCMTDGKEILKNSFEKPIFYIVKRGVLEGSLDQGLKNQAQDLGVNIHFNSNVNKNDVDIISIGVAENKIIAVAKGITFDTEADDIAVSLLNYKTSYNGYSYLLINNGLGTICSVNYYIEGLDINAYFKKTIEMLTELFDFDIRNEKKAGGVGCFLIKPRLIENGKIYTGEAAGLQDFLWGFGMRYAVISGFLAASSIIENKNYAELITQKLSGKIKTSVVNRYVIEMIGDRFNKLMIKRAKRKSNWMDLLYKGYNPSWFSKTIYPIAKWGLIQKYQNFA